MIAFAIIIGAGLACQSAVNGKLRTYVMSPLTASMISFFVGAFLLTCATFASGYIFWDEWTAIKGEPLWILTGGFLGVFSLTMNVVLFPKLGGIQTAVLPIFGQIIMGTLIDQFGWLSSPELPLTTAKILGLAIVFFGVVLATELLTAKQFGDSSNIGWKVIGVVAGMMSAMQASVNGRLGAVLSSPLLSSQISFYVGLATLIIIVLITKSPVRTIHNAVTAGWSKSWIFAGGFFGAVYVFGAAKLAPIIGTGQLMVFALFGQLVCSVLIDRFGLFAAMKKEVTKSKIFGLLCMLLGVIVIKFL